VFDRKPKEAVSENSTYKHPPTKEEVMQSLEISRLLLSVFGSLSFSMLLVGLATTIVA
jgi:hypothetical protein